MTRKDYENIAHVIRNQYDGEVSAVAGALIRDSARRFAEMLKRDNPRFDREKFMLAALGHSENDFEAASARFFKD